MTQEAFKLIAQSIPKQPGVYRYYDDKGTLLYVGKAKNLFKRTSSYFAKNHDSYKTRELVRRIEKIEFTIVNTEQDAFLLENSLIKQYRPVFNIDLKDDKTYPFIVIKKEAFPRVFLTRRKLADGSQYLGPFTSVARVRELLEVVRQLIPLRTCKLNLGAGQLKKGKYKVCLEYHLGNCKGPCEGLQTEASYRADMDQVRNILSGNLSPVMQYLRDEMKQYAAVLAFEKAAVVQKKIEFLENYQARSTVVHASLGTLDVFTIRCYAHHAFINYMQVQNGSIIQTENLQLSCKLDETPAEVLEAAITPICERFHSRATELVLPFEVELLDERRKIMIPKAGPRKKLLDLSQQNTDHQVSEYQKKERLQLTGENHTHKADVLLQLQTQLHLQQLPVHIECFDNSNFHGSYPVSAMVCFRNGLPSKAEYRHYNIKTVTGSNDFASMKEVVYRRYKRLLEEEQPLPQLIVIDGGKGQLSAAAESLKELNIANRVTVVGLAKNVEEIFFTGDRESLKLPYNSKTLLLIRHIRDEVHRFGITFHRKKRSKGTFQNELLHIPGIGAATATALLKTFRSVANVRRQSSNALEAIVGKQKAALLVQYFQQNKKGPG